jgi:predicted DNA-binding transcriptional regulator AlpA
MNKEPLTILRKAEVCARLAICSRSLDAQVSRGEFPAGVKRGKHMTWSLVAVETWRRIRCATRIFGC